MRDIIKINILSFKDRKKINCSIEWFLDCLGKEWETERNKISGIVQNEFHDPRSKIIQMRIFGKLVGFICVSPFDVVGFSDDGEKQKLIKFFEEKRIPLQEVAHIGGLGFDTKFGSSKKIDLIWCSRFLIFSAIKTSQEQNWKYAVGQTKPEGIMVKIAKEFRSKKIERATMDTNTKNWYLKIL